MECKQQIKSKFYFVEEFPMSRLSSFRACSKKEAEFYKLIEEYSGILKEEPRYISFDI